MRTIYKYPLPVEDLCEVEMPAGAEILSLQVQRSSDPCLWALVDTGAEPAARAFRTFGTGHPIPDDFSGNFVGTYQLAGGSLVFHVFDVTTAGPEQP